MTSTYISEIMAKIEAERAAAAESADSARVYLAQAMTGAGVERVDICFSGGGDSGQIDDISIKMREGYEVPSTLKDELENWTYKYLEGTGVDWFNNDGGQGSVMFDCTTAPVTFVATIDVNHTVSDNAWYEEGVA